MHIHRKVQSWHLGLVVTMATGENLVAARRAEFASSPVMRASTTTHNKENPQITLQHIRKNQQAHIGFLNKIFKKKNHDKENLRELPQKHLPKVFSGIGPINEFSSVNNATVFHIGAGGPKTFSRVNRRYFTDGDCDHCALITQFRKDYRKGKNISGDRSKEYQIKFTINEKKNLTFG